jgi:hypothetical protein
VKPAIRFQVVRQCAHRKPCPTPADADAETRWKSTQTIALEPPSTWSEELLEEFVSALAAQADITDLGKVEFRGGPEPGIVTVSGNGHSLSMAISFVPASILGPWLLAHREHGNIWIAVHRPLPRDADGAIRAPSVSTRL